MPEKIKIILSNAVNQQWLINAFKNVGLDIVIEESHWMADLIEFAGEEDLNLAVLFGIIVPTDSRFRDMISVKHNVEVPIKMYVLSDSYRKKFLAEQKV